MLNREDDNGKSASEYEESMRYIITIKLEQERAPINIIPRTINTCYYSNNVYNPTHVTLPAPPSVNTPIKG